MPSEWNGMLKGLALEASHQIHGDSCAVGVKANDALLIEAVLRAKLLPLLEAGEAMRDSGLFHYSKKAWDAAREAALKGSDAKTRQASD